MAGAIQLTEVDFEQIKTNLIDYLKSTKQFTDYDFSGSNLQVILNLIAYQAQLNAYSTNMIANESFLASASIRENVVANARSIGYVPTSATASTSTTNFRFEFTSEDFPSGLPDFIELQPGMVFASGGGMEGGVIYNIIEPQTAPVGSNGTCTFRNVVVYEGTFLQNNFVVNKADFNQAFILENRNIDTTTIRVEVQENPNEEYNTLYTQANNLVEVGEESPVYWIEEVNDQYYELTFGDGFFGKALRDGAKIFVTYLVTNGASSNGIDADNNFTYTGRAISSTGRAVTRGATLISASTTEGGAAIESVSSVKFRAPRDYGSQNRAVIASDYATLIKKIYPAAADVYVYGGEELDIPEYGRVFVAIKPNTGLTLSNLTKNYIINSLSDYRIASLQVVIQDPEVLYLEIDTAVFYNEKATIKDASSIVTEVEKALGSYFVSAKIDQFGGAARYSRIVGAIDDADPSITRNTTFLKMRKDFAPILNAPASYEVCFEQELKRDTNSPVVGSTGFYLVRDGVAQSIEYFFEDDTVGNLYLYYLDQTGGKVIVDPTFGNVDYESGEVQIGYVTPVTITGTPTVGNNNISVRALPFGQDVVAKESVYLELDLANSVIDAIVDTNMLSS